ncbi:MAG TPA: hypothetical protein DEQ34_02575 [Balneolaceae bacterium]|nr:hypothetical protein [Balneolaceae bacterium]|tara:strand:- start:130451 stop:130846 length:396 start_codon:yes stop_codon:yes gene_type:complete
MRPFYILLPLYLILFAIPVSAQDTQEPSAAVVFQYTGSVSEGIYPMDINSELFTKLTVSNSDSTLFLFKDKVETLDAFKAFNPDMIRSITILKDKEEYLKDHLSIEGTNLILMNLKSEYDLWTIVRSEKNR